MVMERLPRTAKMLKDVPKPNRSQYREKLLAAVNALHENNLVHGDLRENNIFVGSDNEVWIMDFDWSGRESVDRYPFSMSPLVVWPEGANNRALLLKEHDKHWLKMHFESDSQSSSSSSSAAKRPRIVCS